MPGVGKSALAYRFASLNKDKFSGGVYIVRIDDFKDINSLAGWFAKKSKGSFDQNDSREARRIMEECFTNGKALLIFDNADLTDNENINKEYIKEINKLFPSKNCSIIVTIQANSVSTINLWTIDKEIQLECFSEIESKELLETIFRDAQKRKTKIDDSLHKNRIDELNDPQNQEALNKIFKTVGNLPLAIEIIGVTLTKLSWKNKEIKDYWEELKDYPHLSLSPEAMEIESSVWYTFFLSLKTLDRETISFFACLGACASGNFSLDLISAVTNRQKIIAEKYLEKLEDRSLISSSQNNRYTYTMHNLLFLFAQIFLKRNYPYEKELSIDFKQAKNNHAQYFLKLVDQKYYLPIPDKIYTDDDYKLPARSNTEGFNYQDIIEELNFNYYNLISAAQWLAKPENFNKNSYRFILSSILRDFLYQYRNQKQYSYLVEKFYSTAKNQEEQKVCENYINLITLDRDSYSQKEDEINNLLEVTEANPGKSLSTHTIKRLKLKCLTSLFWLYIDKARGKIPNKVSKEENFSQAKKYLENIDKLFTEFDDENIKFLVSENLNVLKSRFHFYKAEAYDFKPNTKTDLEEALKFAKKTLDDFEHQPNEILFLMDMRLGQLGEILLHLGKFFKQENPKEAKKSLEDAQEYLEHSLKISKAIKHSHGSAIVLKNLGKTYKELISFRITEKELLFEQAKKCFLQSYEQDKELNNNIIPKKSGAISELFDLYIRQDKDLQGIINEILDNLSNNEKNAKERLIRQACKYLNPTKGRVSKIYKSQYYGFITSNCLPGKDIYFDKRSNSSIFHSLKRDQAVEFTISYLPDNPPNKKWRAYSVNIV